MNAKKSTEPCTLQLVVLHEVKMKVCSVAVILLCTQLKRIFVFLPKPDEMREISTLLFGGNPFLWDKWNLKLQIFFIVSKS